MAMGADLLLKSFGIDPKEITATIGQFGQMIVNMQNQMNAIEKNQQEILRILQARGELAAVDVTPKSG